MDILLTIRPFGAPAPIKSVEEGLATYFEQETLDGENQYQCDKCGKKTDATKGLRLRTVPYILSLQIKRFDYDWELDRRVKLDDEVGTRPASTLLGGSLGGSAMLQSVA